MNLETIRAYLQAFGRVPVSIEEQREQFVRGGCGTREQFDAEALVNVHKQNVTLFNMLRYALEVIDGQDGGQGNAGR